MQHINTVFSLDSCASTHEAEPRVATTESAPLLLDDALLAQISGGTGTPTVKPLGLPNQGW